MYVGKWESATRAWATSEVPDASHQNPIIRQYHQLKDNVEELNSLFWVISRIRKYPRIKSSCYAIRTLDSNAVLISFQEVFVEKNSPLFMGEFAVTMRKEFFIQLLPCVLCCKVFEGIWQLTRGVGIRHKKRARREDYLFKVGNMLTEVA